MNMPIIARDLYRFFHAGDEETLALRGVSLAVAPGEIVVVVGPSGSGKSTLLSCLAGLDDPDGGVVHIQGVRISRRPERERTELRRKHIGVVYQQWNLLSHLTVQQNIQVVRSLIHDQTVKSRLVPIPDLLTELQIDHRAGAYPQRLSGGESARAAIAVAVAADPAVLIADEPTGELDQLTENAVLGLFASQAARGVAVIVASHSPNVEAAADRVIRMRDGAVAS
ncbi:MAG: transporter related protein [Propionibacteriaceae bacterium]|nr:transporter related protein [Propionibacteriaceae bacterium]